MQAPFSSNNEVGNKPFDTLTGLSNTTRKSFYTLTGLSNTTRKSFYTLTGLSNDPTDKRFLKNMF
jgi:hypothetical protein